jgi:hypothetical protein
MVGVREVVVPDQMLTRIRVQGISVRPIADLEAGGRGC